MKRFLFACVSMINLAYAQNCKTWGVLEVGADWIYWQAYQDNLEYAAHETVTLPNSIAPIATINSETIAPRFRVNSGFKVFSNYGLPDSDWQIGAFYTNLYSNAKRRDVVPAGDNIKLNSYKVNPILQIFAPLVQYSLNEIDSRWCSNYNCLDLDVSKMVSVCKNIDLTLHSGIRGMWVRQKLHVSGAGPEIPSFLNPQDAFTFESVLQQQFDGYGLEAGIKADVQLGYHLSLTAQLGTSLLYSRIHVHEEIRYIDLVSPEFSSLLGVNNAIWHLSPTLDGFIGLSFAGDLESFNFDFHVGWEQHLIINFNRFQINNNTDFTLQGLTLGGSITF